ncbi:MAG: sugar ABC transporter substrate-binding protein [Clostridiales bacterium]|nr:sugar ABC transporter substrate-binding protein [Clostridiales bacterium]
MKRIISILICATMMLSTASCMSNVSDKHDGVNKLTAPLTESPTTTSAAPSRSDIIPTDSSDVPDTNPSAPDVRRDQIVDMTMMAFASNNELNDNNEIREIIAEKTGVRLHESWGKPLDASESVGAILASGQYPDLIDGGDACDMLYESGCLIAWDEYLSIYPNLRAMYSDKQWELFRQSDGHIYYANVFGSTYGEPKSTTHDDSAFWIQVRVLEYLGYPKISTLDEYFNALETYYSANHTNTDGTQIIPYMALSEGWRYYCLESAPQLLDGYAYDGSVSVNTKDYSTPTIVDYNTTTTAKQYFRKLNEEYKKGILVSDFDTMDYDTYIARLATGSVLGMFDQAWDFQQINGIFKERGLDALGYEYVPLGLTISSGMENRYHDYYGTPNSMSGLGVTTQCSDPDLAFSFLNQCLDQEIHDLRFWGIEGVDYLADSGGTYYRTRDMRANWANEDYQKSHCCTYSYLPQWHGTSRDGKNAMLPSEQPGEFYATLSDPVRRCFDAYGYKTYTDFLNSVKEEPGCWYPLYVYSNMMDSSTAAGFAWMKMGDCKHEYLPYVIKASEFEGAWKEYMDAYSACRPDDFLNEMQDELNRRVANAS